jgi:ATP-dependent Clp protease ATP-binding subunit ClpA
VLVAIFSEQESQAVYFLKSQSVSRLDVVNFITHGISKVDEGEERRSERESRSPESSGRAREQPPGQLCDQPQRGGKGRVVSIR